MERFEEVEFGEDSVFEFLELLVEGEGGGEVLGGLVDSTVFEDVLSGVLEGLKYLDSAEVLVLGCLDVFDGGEKGGLAHLEL